MNMDFGRNLNTMKEKWKDLIFVFVEERHDISDRE